MSSAFNIPAGWIIEPTELPHVIAVTAPTGARWRLLRDSNPDEGPSQCLAALAVAMLDAAPPVDAVPGEPVAWVDSRELGRLHESGLLRIDAWREDFLNTRQPLFATSVASRAGSEPTMDAMVNRFLSWKLPSDFSPDAGITFKRFYNETSPFGPSNHEPTGTNLLTGEQARAMLEHVVGRSAEPRTEQQIIKIANELPGVGDCISGNAAIAFARALDAAPIAPAAAAEPSELADMEARKDAAYLERNQVVAALAKCFPSGVARTAIEGWSEDWHGCVFIDLPTGQASWHFHDSQAYLFTDLPPYAGAWDGHDTPEKYRRLAALPDRERAASLVAGEEKK